jgi:predicted DCC family thiol-disulfide oxidoreductase YuxK
MPIRPVLVYDGDCAFCSTCVAFAERRLRPRCVIVPWQRADLPSLGLDRRRAEYEVLWVTPAGAVHGGAEAVAKLLLGAGGAWAVVGALLRMPPLRWIAHGGYRLVADNRHRMPGGTPACALPADHRSVTGVAAPVPRERA